MTVLIVSALVVQSCRNKDKEDPVPAEGRVEFSFEVIDNPDGGRTKGDGGRVEADIPTKVVISIEDDLGNPVYTLEELSLFEFNGSYVTEPLILQVGNYQLTEYLVLDDEGSTIYATPQEGSHLDYLVADPLPIALAVSANSSTSLAPQVISTEELTPADFGYTDSNFEFVATYDMLLSVFVQNATTGAFESTDANLTVIATNETLVLYNKAIGSGIIQVKLIDGYDTYTVQVDKAGYDRYSANFTQAEMKAFFTDPLIVNLFPPAAVAVGGVINDFAAASYQGPEVFATPSGGFIVSGNRGGGGTEGFVYDASSALIGSFTTGHHTRFETGLAVLNSGEFITTRVVGSELRAVIYNADGSVKVADHVFRNAAANAENMQVVTDGTLFLLVWSEGNTLFFQKMDANGTLVGGIVNPANNVNLFIDATRRRGLEVSMNSNGDFVVVTRSSVNQGYLAVTEFNADLTVKTAEFSLIPTASGINTFSMVDLDDSGNYVIVWARAEDNIVRMAGFSLGGNSLFSEVVVGQARTKAPDVAINASGMVVVAYPGGAGSPNTQDVVLRLYDLSGNAIDDEVFVGTVPTQATTAKVTFVDGSHFVVVYGDESAGIGHTQYTQKFTL